MNRTTAQLHEAARLAEQQMRWDDAAQLWEMAIAVYPVAGALADLDKAKMQRRAIEALRQRYDG